MSAFQRAYEKGLKIIEADIHITKDGIPVALHDSTIDRTSNGSGSIANLTYEEANQYIYNCDMTDFDNEHLPTLDELVKFCKENGICLELDLANRGFTRAQKLIIYNIILENDMLGSTMFTATDSELSDYMSFNSTIIVSVSGITTASGATTTMAKYESCALAFASVGSSYVASEIIEAVHNMGMLVKTWTVNSEETAQKFAEMGVDAIISDSLLTFPTV